MRIHYGRRNQNQVTNQSLKHLHLDVYVQKTNIECDTHAMYCSVLLYFLARYLAEALLGILTKESSLL